MNWAILPPLAASDGEPRGAAGHRPHARVRVEQRTQVLPWLDVPDEEEIVAVRQPEASNDGHRVLARKNAETLRGGQGDDVGLPLGLGESRRQVPAGRDGGN